VSQSYTPEAFWLLQFDSDGYYAFNCATASLAAALNAANEGFIDLYAAGERLAFCINHGHTESLQHGPGDSVLGSDRPL